MSLLAWYPLLSNGNNQGLDGTNLSTMGTITYTDGKLGKSSTFTGNAANCLHRAGFKLTDKFTWTCWFKVDADTSNLQFILSEGRDHTNVGISLVYYNSKISIRGIIHDFATVTTGIWYHFALTVDSSDKVKLYINGKLAASCNYFIPNYTESSDRFAIGKMSFGYNNTSVYFPFYGQVCDIRIYDEVLSQKEIYEISKGLTLHYKLSGFGGDNLLINSGKYTINSPYTITGAWKDGAITTDMYCEVVPGETYILQCETDGNWATHSGVTTVSTNCTMWLYLNKTYNPSNMGYENPVCFHKNNMISNGVWKYTIPDGYTMARVRLNTYSDGITATTVKFWNIKLEKGSKATPWCPNSADTLYSTLGYNDRVEYDCSGFGNHGTKTDGITWDGNAIKYNGSYNFPNSKYIIAPPSAKITDQITVNIWSYMNTWQDCHPFSCTEQGGWNLEANNGYISFPIYALNHGYQYTISPMLWTGLTSGWHMFTGIWDGYSVKLYIDGELDASSTPLSAKTKISYNSSNTIFLHAEAGGNSATPASSNYPECNLSDFRIYATALSDEDIKALYNTKFSVDNQGDFYCGELVETTTSENSNFNVNGILECISMTEGNEKFSISKDGEIYSNNLIEL